MNKSTIELNKGNKINVDNIILINKIKSYKNRQLKYYKFNYNEPK